MGTLLLLFPNQLLAILWIKPASEPWIQAAGSIAMALSIVYRAGVQHKLRPVVLASCHARAVPCLALLILGINSGVYQLCCFGMLDGITALYTYHVYCAEEKCIKECNKN
eukprot:340750-Ditylum_brightwellii.AAC.2